jgi:hypothetical protein
MGRAVFLPTPKPSALMGPASVGIGRCWSAVLPVQHEDDLFPLWGCY